MSQVPRSMEATTTAAAAEVARRRTGPPSGWWGMALLAATEGALFGTLIGAYFYLRFRAAEWPPAGIAPPEPVLPIVLTAGLVLATVPMLLAVRAARDGRTRHAWLWILAALVIQGGYLAVQIVLYVSDLGKFSIDDTAYGSIYFTLLGVHHAHVAVGLLLNAWLVGRLLGGLTNYRANAVRVTALYWYFVSAVAMLVVATQLSAS